MQTRGLFFKPGFYGFDRIQTRVPGFDIWLVTCQWQTHTSCTINSYAAVRWKCGWLDTYTIRDEASVETTPHKHYEYELGNATRVPENPGNPPVF